MPVGNVTGLSSGIQWDETVKLLMQIEHRPVDMLELRRSTYESQLTNWSAIESKISALQDRAAELDTLKEFLQKSGSSSDSDVLTVTASADAIAASHDVIVNQLATSAVHVHQTGWADANSTAVNSSGSNKSFSYDYEGTTITVTVADSTTLQGLVNLINRDSNNPGVAASIVNDGTGGGSDYHLVMTGTDTGAGNDVTIIDTLANPTDIGALGTEFDEAGWDTTQAAQNAQIRVDGIPDPGWGYSWIESDSNSVDDVIPGVTLQLKNTSGGNPVQVDISMDNAAIKSSVKGLIAAFNDVVSTINSTTRYDAENETAGPLAGDALARNLKSELMNLIAQNIPGTDSGDALRSLGQAGVKLSSGGGMALDETAFDEALVQDALGVARLFAFDSVSSSTYFTVRSHGEDTVGGTYNWTVSYDASGGLDSGGTNTVDGNNGIVHGTQILEGARNSDVAGLLMSLTNPGDGPNTKSGTVKVYTGLSVLLYNHIADMVESTDGSFKLNRDRIGNSVDLLDQQITSWEKRLESIEKGYNSRFSAMETLIGQMKNMGNYLNSIG